MKVALFSYHFAEYAYLLGLALSARHSVLLFMHRENVEKELGRRVLEEKHDRLQIILQEKRGPKDPRFISNIAEIIKHIRGFKPDVIHYQESLNYAFTLARLLYGRNRLVLTIHDHIPHSGASYTKHASLHRNYLRRIPDAVIVHGERIRVETETILPRLKNRVFTIPHGPIGEQHQADGLDWETGCLLFFGRVEKYKGLRHLIEAVDILKRQGVNVRVVIAGQGRDLDTCKDSLNGNDAFEVHDRFIERHEVPGFFKRANIVVLPYTDATQSGIAAMAMQFGRPTIATRVGSVEEIVRHDFNGIIVPPRDSQSLASAIRSLVSDQELARKFARNAISLAETELSWAAIADKTADVYGFVTNQRGGAG